MAAAETGSLRRGAPLATPRGQNYDMANGERGPLDPTNYAERKEPIAPTHRLRSFLIWSLATIILSGASLAIAYAFNHHIFSEIKDNLPLFGKGIALGVVAVALTRLLIWAGKPTWRRTAVMLMLISLVAFTYLLKSHLYLDSTWSHITNGIHSQVRDITSNPILFTIGVEQGLTVGLGLIVLHVLDRYHFSKGERMAEAIED